MIFNCFGSLDCKNSILFVTFDVSFERPWNPTEISFGVSRQGLPPQPLLYFLLAIFCLHFAADVWWTARRRLLAATPKFLYKRLTANGQSLFSGFLKPPERFCKGTGCAVMSSIPDSNGIAMWAPFIITCPLDDLYGLCENLVWTDFGQFWPVLGLKLSRSGPDGLQVRPGTGA